MAKFAIPGVRMIHQRLILICLAVALSITSRTFADEPTTTHPRHSVPTPAAQAAALRIIRDIYKTDYEKRSDSDRDVFAKKLLSESQQTSDDATALFVMLRESRDIAAGADDVETALTAANTMTADFQIDPIEAIVPALSARPTTSAAARAVVTSDLNLITVALDAENYPQALKLASQVEYTARLTRDPRLVELAASHAADVRRISADAQRLKPQLEKLHDAPDDPDANFAVGKFYCISKGDWSRGLAFLAKGSDADFASAARREETNPTKGLDIASVAEGWWDIASAGKQSKPIKTALLSHAADWYIRALPLVTGLDKARVQARLADIGPTAGMIAVTFTWNAADDADIYLNGQPLREYTPDFRTRGDEAIKVFTAEGTLRRGDVITAGVRRGGASGLIFVATDTSNKVVFQTNPNIWRVYQPTDISRWFAPSVATDSPSINAVVPTQQWTVQKTLSAKLGGNIVSIWSTTGAPPEKGGATAYFYTVVP